MSENSKEKQRLLIVDDSKVIRVTARKILRDHFETVEAVDGEDAWERLTGGEAYALVVSDLTMPRLDGFGLLERIRNSHLPHVRELPVIIITGANDSEATMERARQAGATDFIGKPFDAVHLLARTQAHAGSHAVTTILQRVNTALEEQSATDTATGLLTEAAFMERGYQQLSYVLRHGGSLAMVRMEIDRFGELFRQHGETFTSAVIQALGKILADAIRQEDTAARIGTARFSVLLPGMDRRGTGHLAERVLHTFSTRQFPAGADVVNVTLSIGVAAPAISRNFRFEDLVSAADRHLARALSHGGNRIVYDDTGTAPSGFRRDTAAPEPVVEAAVACELPALVAVLADGVEEIGLAAEAPPAVAVTREPYEPAVVECLAPAAREPAGERFAGPVPDDRFEPAPMAREDTRSPEPAARPPDTARARIPFDFLPEDEEESIVITAPFSTDAGSMPPAWAAESSVSPTQADDALPADPEEAGVPDSERKHKGFFSRALGLFGRFRSRH